MGKQTSPSVHILYLSLTSFLTFLLSLAVLCRNISARAVTTLTLLGLRTVCGMCHSCHGLPPGTGTSQLRVRWEQISLGSHGWHREVLEQYKRQMLFAHGGASGGQAYCEHQGHLVLLCLPSSLWDAAPPPKFGDLLKVSLCHV